jgi:hypothetical protein
MASTSEPQFVVQPAPIVVAVAVLEAAEVPNESVAWTT